CTSRQTSDRPVPISSAILVPLTTTVAFSISNRTIRPSRKSVRCGASSCGGGRLARERVLELRPVASLVMQGIMRERDRKNNPNGRRASRPSGNGLYLMGGTAVLYTLARSRKL